MAGQWYDKDVPPVEWIQQRLAEIFPEGVERRSSCVSKAAARTVFVALYGAAVEGEDRWFRPHDVIRMTEERALRATVTSAEERRTWLSCKRQPGEGEGWYKGNTREVVRDETLSEFRAYGAVVVRPNLSMHSSSPRWALARDFASLFDPALDHEARQAAIKEWQERHLPASARARIAVLQRHLTADSGNIPVNLPDGRRQILMPGPSSALVRDVIEEFAPRFLNNPIVVWVGEGTRAADWPKDMAQLLGLTLRQGSEPDVVLFDADAKPGLLVFVEVDVTGGPVTISRKAELLSCAPGWKPEDCTFVTVFKDRNDPQYRKDQGDLAWDTFVWFGAEPDSLVYLVGGAHREAQGRNITLATLLGRKGDAEDAGKSVGE